MTRPAARRWTWREEPCRSRAWSWSRRGPPSRRCLRNDGEVRVAGSQPCGPSSHRAIRAAGGTHLARRRTFSRTRRRGG